jgi:hypothetical protein
MAAKRLQFVTEDVGKTFGSSKKRVTWKFWFYGDEEVRNSCLLQCSSGLAGRCTTHLILLPARAASSSIWICMYFLWV